MQNYIILNTIWNELFEPPALPLSYGPNTDFDSFILF